MRDLDPGEQAEYLVDSADGPEITLRGLQILSRQEGEMAQVTGLVQAPLEGNEFHAIVAVTVSYWNSALERVQDYQALGDAMPGEGASTARHVLALAERRALARAIARRLLPPYRLAEDLLEPDTRSTGELPPPPPAEDPMERVRAQTIKRNGKTVTWAQIEQNITHMQRDLQDPKPAPVPEDIVLAVALLQEVLVAWRKGQAGGALLSQRKG